MEIHILHLTELSANDRTPL